VATASNFFQNITAIAVMGVGKKIPVYAVIKTLIRILINKTLESVFIMHSVS